MKGQRESSTVLIARGEVESSLGFLATEGVQPIGVLRQRKTWSGSSGRTRHTRHNTQEARHTRRTTRHA